MTYLLLGLGGCDRIAEQVAESVNDHSPDVEVWFTEIAAKSGLSFVHTSGAAGDYYFPEIAGSGCALFDYDGDGDLDVYAVQSFSLDELKQYPERWKSQAPGDTGMNRLYRNDLILNQNGTATPHFVEVTETAGIGNRGYGMGCAVGDIDNDGDLDLYVTNFGPNVLYLNNGDGTFKNVSVSSISDDARWSTGASFFDFDQDGWLDLYVVNYVNFSVIENKRCHSPSGRRDYCGPASFDPVPDRLFHNNGDGSFTDVTIEAGIDRAYGSGLGVICADFNNNGLPDIYVANDGNANQLWINQGDGTFKDEAMIAGAAYNESGVAEAGMGVTAEDYDDDGDTDIFISHLATETNTALINNGRGIFFDETNRLRLGAVSRSFTGFGTSWIDFDHDGDLDLFVANGAVTIIDRRASETNPYAFANQLLRNDQASGAPYVDISHYCGDAMRQVETSRGAAFGDIDNDGDIDILISNRDGPLRLLRNDIGDKNHWLGVRLIINENRSDESGTLIELIRNDRSNIFRRVHTDGSYLATCDSRVVFGLGSDDSNQTVFVRWPDSAVEQFHDLKSDQYHELRQNTGSISP